MAGQRISHGIPGEAVTVSSAEARLGRRGQRFRQGEVGGRFTQRHGIDARSLAAGQVPQGDGGHDYSFRPQTRRAKGSHLGQKS